MALEPPSSARPLSIAWSQDELHRRTAAGRLVARYGRRMAALAGAAFVVLVVWLVVGVALAEQALHPVRRPLGAAAVQSARTLAGAHSATLASVPLVAHDGALLHAWSFTPARRARGTVLLLHGLGDTRLSQLALAGLLLDDGYRVVAPDSRAHGTSGGALATYGILERSDVRAWTAWVRQRHSDECVFAMGASMGAAIALQALDREPFCAVVAEAPYATFARTARLRVGRQFGAPPGVAPLVAGPFVEAAMLYARVRYGLAFWRANPLDGVARARVPVLVIEDGDDDRVPGGDAARLAAANPDHVTVWIVEGAPHAQAWRSAPAEYPRRVLAFLAAHQ